MIKKLLVFTELRKHRRIGRSPRVALNVVTPVAARSGWIVKQVDWAIHQRPSTRSANIERFAFGWVSKLAIRTWAPNWKKIVDNFVAKNKIASNLQLTSAINDCGLKKDNTY